MFEVIEHTADVGLRVQAPDLEQLFAEAARGMFSLMVVHPDAVAAHEALEVSLPAAAPDDLLVDWLSELLFVFEFRHLVLSEFTVKVNRGGLQAVARGAPLDPQQHEIGYEVKAVTYHRLRVERQAEGWIAELFLDL